MNIAETCIRKATVTVSLAVALALAGTVSYFNLGRLEDPEFTIKSAQVITSYPGATAVEVAEEVTDRLEVAVQQLGQLKRVTSTSYPGRSIILVEIKDRYSKNDLPQIWDELRRKVNDVKSSLPSGCGEPLVCDDYGDVYGVFYAIYGDGYTHAELKEHAKLLQRELLLCEDVAKIDMVGDRQEIVSFEISRSKMAHLGITPAMIRDAVSGRNIAADAGCVRIDDKHVRIYPQGKIESVEEYEDLILAIADDSGKVGTVRLKDIMTIRRDYEENPSCLVRYNGHPAIGLGVSTAKGGNVITMGNSIDRRMRQLLPETPIGIEVGVISHQASSVKAAVDGFVINLIESVVIVIAVLLLTMGFKSGILIGAVLVLTVLGTVFLMDVAGILFERISLGAFIIALGMLVDNAIVVTEAVLIAAKKGEDLKKAACDVVRQTQWPLLGATVIAVLSFAPIGASQDSTGEYCRSLFLVLMLSLLMSWLLAITVTPLLASRFLKSRDAASSAPTGKAEPDPYGGAFFRCYRRFLELCIRNRGFTWIVLGFMFAIAALGFGRVKSNFFPDSTRPQFMVHLWMPEGSSIHATEQRVERLSAELRRLEGVTGVTGITGCGGLRFLLTYGPEDMNSSYGIMFVDVESDRQIAGLMERINDRAQTLVPDALVYCQRFVLGPGDAQKIQMRIMGPDAEVLREFAERVIAVMREDPRLVEIQSDWRNRVDRIEPVIAEDRSRKLGMTRADIAEAFRCAVEGVTVGAYHENDESLPIVIRAPEPERSDPDSILSAWAWSNVLNSSVPLAQVVSGFSNESEESRVKRRNRLPCITVKCNTTGETASEAFARIRPKLEDIGSSLPTGFIYEWGGEYESSQNANSGLSGKIPPIIVVMVLITIALFNSFRQAAVIFMTLPLVLIGVTAGLLGFGQPFGFMALLGLLSLVGMQIKNAIVLIDEINAQMAAGVGGFDAVVMAGVTRLRPVVNASLTTVLGMMPLVADAFYAAMAVTIMCGLAFATVMTMIVVPVNYALIYRIKAS